MKLLQKLLIIALLTASKPVVIEEWIDFHCPYCVKFVKEVLPKIEEKYGDDVILKINHLPLTDLHPNAKKVAEAAVCAERQNLFWEMHDAIIDNNAQTESQLISIASSIGANAIEFEMCLRFGQATKKVENDMKKASELGVTGTPFFLIEDVPIGGYAEFESFDGLISRALKQETRLSLKDIDPPIKGKIIIDPRCGERCEKVSTSFLNNYFPTLEIEKVYMTNDSIPWSPYVTVDSNITKAYRFGDIARNLRQKGNEFIIRPAVLSPVFINKDIAKDGRPQLGESDKNKIVLYTSFTCPYCAKQVEEVFLLEGEMNITFKHFIRTQSDVVFSQIAECVNINRPERFWQFSLALLDSIPQDEEALFQMFSSMTGLSKEIFESCKTDEKIIDIMVEDMEEANMLGIDATPATVINNFMYVGLVRKKDLIELTKNEKMEEENDS